MNQSKIQMMNAQVNNFHEKGFPSFMNEKALHLKHRFWPIWQIEPGTSNRWPISTQKIQNPTGDL